MDLRIRSPDRLSLFSNFFPQAQVQVGKKARNTRKYNSRDISGTISPRILSSRIPTFRIQNEWTSLPTLTLTASISHPSFNCSLNTLPYSVSNRSINGLEKGLDPVLGETRDQANEAWNSGERWYLGK
jgi:hypothetical protein